MRTVQVPDFGDSASPWQPVQVAEPGDIGYPTPKLPEADPWARHVNPVIDDIEAAAEEEPQATGHEAEAS